MIMLLTVDVGNTHTVIGGYGFDHEGFWHADASQEERAASCTCDSESLQFVWRMATNKKQTED